MMRRSLYLILALVFISGCKQGSFLERRYDNFTAYYNTFYNAQDEYRRGVKALEPQARPVDRGRYLSLFEEVERGYGTNNFNEAIKKSADLLRKHPRSRWTDNALMLIGQSYFYMGNHVGAEQKFTEVIQLGTVLEDEARFWLARTLVTGGTYDVAANVLQEILSRDDVHPRWQALSQLLLGELYVKQGAWDRAAQELTQGLDMVRDASIAARAQFLLGQVYETMERYTDAADAYALVMRHRPPYELAYAAQFSQVAALGLHGHDDDALRLLRRMMRDDKHYAMLGELHLLQARILHASDSPREALAIYDDLLYHTTDATATRLRGEVHYRLAELFRDAYADYFLAAVHFDTASTALRAAVPTGSAMATASPAVRHTPVAIIDAPEQADVFRSFKGVASRVMEMDSLLYLGSLSQAAFDSAITEIRHQRARELEARQAELARRQAEADFMAQSSGNQSGFGGNTRNQGADPSDPGTGGSFGFLSHMNLGRVQEANINFRNTWGDRPLVPNWRRQSAVSAAQRAPVAGEGRGDADRGGRAADARDNLPVVDISGIPRDPESQARMRAQRAMARYEMANVLFLSMAMPDSAASWYRIVVEEDHEEPVAQRALYALAEVHRALGDTLASDRLYRFIVDQHPDTEFAIRARENLGLTALQVTRNDSLQLAEQDYHTAYQQWQQGLYPDAMRAMVLLAVQYEETAVAPRALMAAGRIYGEWALRDGLDILGPLSYDLIGPLLPAEEEPDAEALTEEPASNDSHSMADNLPVADTLFVQDTLLVADSLFAADTLLADSLFVADTLLVADTLVVPEPSEEVAAEPAWTIAHVYRIITEQYPNSPFASQAERILSALTEEAALRLPQPDTVSVDTASVEMEEDVQTELEEDIQIEAEAPADASSSASSQPRRP